MDKLQDVMADYESLVGKTYKYELLDKNNLEVNFKTENFPHVMGLHKLINIKDLDKLNKKRIKASKIYKKLKSQEITNDMILQSPYYSKIENRFKYFYKIKELVFQKVIYDFDRTRLRTQIAADLVLYTIQDNLYIHLFLVKQKQGYYVPMTFIVEVDNRYVKGQIDYDIKKLCILEKGKDNLEYIYIPNYDSEKESAVTKENNNQQSDDIKE